MGTGTAAGFAKSSQNYFSVRSGYGSGKREGKSQSTGTSTKTEKFGDKPPEFKGGQVTESQFLNSIKEWLGSEYKSLPNGRYLSKDGLRQVRYGKHESTGKQHHGHFEIYDQSGGKIIENTVVKIIKD